MDYLKKLENLQNVETLEQDLATAKTEAELQEVLKNHGVELTAEELQALVANAAKDASKEELSAEDLDDVAGGAWWTPVIVPILKWIAKNTPMPRVPRW